MMAFFMMFYRWVYFKPHFNGELLFSDFDFIIFVLAIVLGAGSGFMINDLYDIDIDNQNHTKNTFKTISPKTIWWIYGVMNLICGGVTVYLVFKYQIESYLLIYPISTVLLWFYSFKLKRTFLLGNLTISLLIAGLVIFIFPFIELNHLNLVPSIHFTHVLFLTTLSFLLNLAREIIKDVEDRKGDELFGCKTMPIVLGVNRTKQIVVFLFGLTSFTFLGFLAWLQVSLEYTGIFYSLFLIFISALICLIKFAKTNLHFHRASTLLKILMLLGIISVIVWI